MHILAINGSPRKNNNTAILLKKVLEGAASKGAATTMVNLYDLNYKGCISCFACKLINGKSYGKCALKDDLTPIMETIANADAIVLGSPIYLHSITSSMKAFLERLIFQYLVYDQKHSTLFPKKIRVGLIYTMNATHEQFAASYENELKSITLYLTKVFGSCENLLSNDTYQFNDYSKYFAPIFDERKKHAVRTKQFPQDCKNAFNMGVRFTT
ncbi:flavodoxin family protein [Pectinatus frisingensis]|uniref:flavodoxin family protein n=1 Tax=Pectinatus frisingensis TaxID=865 RepID=UPI0018C73EB5|nr:flavodoxin family protein [Pectinatus frisingensis]